MLTSVIEWHDASVELPTESGDYLTYMESKAIMDMPYSPKYKAFNIHDWFDEDLAEKYKIMPLYWAEKPALPTAESEGV